MRDPSRCTPGPAVSRRWCRPVRARRHAATPAVSSSCAWYKVPDQLQPRLRPVLRLDLVGVTGPHEMPADVRPAVEAVEVDQAVGFTARGLIHRVEVAGDHEAPRPAAVVVVRAELSGVGAGHGLAPGTVNSF